MVLLEYTQEEKEKITEIENKYISESDDYYTEHVKFMRNVELRQAKYFSEHILELVKEMKEAIKATICLLNRFNEIKNEIPNKSELSIKTTSLIFFGHFLDTSLCEDISQLKQALKNSSAS